MDQANRLKLIVRLSIKDRGGDEPDVVLDELVRVEAMGGDNVGSAYEALELYIKNGFHQP